MGLWAMSACSDWVFGIACYSSAARFWASRTGKPKTQLDLGLSGLSRGKGRTLFDQADLAAESLSRVVHLQQIDPI